MYDFLCTNRINALQGTYYESGVKVYQTNGIMCQIYIGFAKKCTVWLPYNKLKELLTDPTYTRNLLTTDHHHLLLVFEHFTELEPGTPDVKGTY